MACLGGLILWPCSQKAAAEVRISQDLPAGAAASVNGRVIPQLLVGTFLKNDREALGIDPTTEAGRTQLASLPASILDELIDRALIAQEVHRRGIAPSEASLDADERRLVTFCGSEDRYDAYTAQNGFARQEYRENVLRPAANGRTLIDALTQGLTVSDEEISAYYGAHHAEADFQLPERVTGAHILINTRPDMLANRLAQAQKIPPGTPEMKEAVAKETERLRGLADTVRQQAVAPRADFAALAKKYSDDVGTRDEAGNLGTFARGVHPVVLDDAFFALRPGEIGPVVQTDFGFHVVRLGARLPAGQKTLAEATPEIRLRLQREKNARQLREWLADARGKADILIRKAGDLPSAR